MNRFVKSFIDGMFDAVGLIFTLWVLTNLFGTPLTITFGS